MMNMNRLFCKFKRPLAAAVIAAAFTSLAACADEGDGAGNRDAGDGTIKLGAWLSLSGPLANVGVPMQAGNEAYWGQLNADGGISGRKVEWTALDNAYDPQQTIQVARQLVGQEDVIAIVGATGTSQSEAAFPFVLDQSKVPILGPYAGLETWYDPPRDNLYGTFPANEDSSRAAARWIADDGAKTVTIVRDDLDSFAVAGDAAQRDLEAAGVEVKTVEVKLGTTDFAPVIPKVKAQDPDAVLTLMPTSEVAAYLNAAALDGFSAPAYGYAVAVSMALLELAGENAEGYKGVSPTLPPNSDDPAVQEYRDAMAKYSPDAELDFYSLAMYAYADVFAQIAATVDGPLTPESIAAAYDKADNVETGIAGPMDFTEGHLGTHDLVRVAVEGGEWQQVGGFMSGAEK
jgi:branched-chain amino acid transport system substrate-binding protein